MQQPLLDPEAAYEALPGAEPHENGGYHAGATNGAAGPDLVESGEVEFGAVANLDLFFERVYRYYEEKGFWVIVTARVLNLAALGFTAAFSGFLLLWVDWGALRSACLLDDTCDILDVAIVRHPLQHGGPLWIAARLAYLALLAAYWLWNLAHLAADLKGLAEVRHFCNVRLGLSERAMQTVTWPEVAHRIVEVQQNLRLCIKRDLTEHDIVSRIMRKDNYLIGMLNKGVLALNVPLVGAGRRFMLTKTLELNLRWGLLDHMFDEATFTVRPEFVSHPDLLARRFRRMAWANFVLAPFLLVFLAMYLFLRNAEAVYHHPSSVGARRWSPLARWRLREFNELPHYIDHRLNASHRAAEKYMVQFPSPLLAHVARFVAFIAGSFAALFLGAALVEDALLERHLGGRTLVWWAATLGVVLAVSRAFIVDSANAAFHPELAMLEVVAHTHHLPRHWRGRAHTQEVQGAFQQLFQFKVALLAEEMLSILLTPFVLYFSLPQCAGAIAAFVRENTVYVEGLGDVCSLATFDLARHGNPRYGSPVACPKGARSRQGKVEKSLLSFATTYPGWEPGAAAKQFLSALRPPLQDAPPPDAPAAASVAGSKPRRRGAAAAAAAAQSLASGGVFASAVGGAWPPGGGAAGPHFPFTAHLPDISRQGAAASRLPPPSGYWQPGPPSAMAIRGGGSIFASAELPGDPRSAAALVRSGIVAGSWAGPRVASPVSVLDVEDCVAASQIMLQSFYEEQEDAATEAAHADADSQPAVDTYFSPPPPGFRDPSAADAAASGSSGGRRHEQSGLGGLDPAVPPPLQPPAVWGRRSTSSSNVSPSASSGGTGSGSGGLGSGHTYGSAAGHQRSATAAVHPHTVAEPETLLSPPPAAAAAPSAPETLAAGGVIPPSSSSARSGLGQPPAWLPAAQQAAGPAGVPFSGPSIRRWSSLGRGAAPPRQLSSEMALLGHSMPSAAAARTPQTEAPAV